MGYTESYVAFLDILGFKNFIGTSTFEEVLEVFTQITEGREAKQALFRACEEGDTSLQCYNLSLEKTKISIMSDSIIVSTPAEYRESLCAIVDICCIIQYYLLDCRVPVLLRGAIAKGDIYQNEEMIFGKGMIDAYLAQENISRYPRIILSKSLAEEMEDVSAQYDGRSRLVLGEDEYYHIDCLREYLFDADERINLWKYEKIQDYIEGQLSEYTTQSVREKMFWLKAECGKLMVDDESE